MRRACPIFWVIAIRSVLQVVDLDIEGCGRRILGNIDGTVFQLTEIKDLGMGALIVLARYNRDK